jgi:hypothetical protein
MKLKFGFDIHGVLDDLPETFVAINNALYHAGHEIHILTGSHASERVFKQLADLGILYHKFFSIADHHKDKGTKIWYDEKNTPWIDRETWNATKGEYCQVEGIHLHFDDSIEYERYFTTPFARVWTKNNRNGRGIKPDMSAFDEITSDNLNAAGFIKTYRDPFLEKAVWSYHKEKEVITVEARTMVAYFTYIPDTNKLADTEGNSTQPQNMSDINRFMEAHKPC